MRQMLSFPNGAAAAKNPQIGDPWDCVARSVKTEISFSWKWDFLMLDTNLFGLGNLIENVEDKIRLVCW